MLKLFNTLSRTKEVFKPLNPEHVTMYCCGPTVYNYAHIGNLRTYVFEDILRRVLLYKGYKLKHVMNITDVGHLTSDADEGEDKIEKEARLEKKSAWDIAKFYTEAFFNDTEKLNIQRPDIVCKATDHIPEMIGMIEKIEKNGYAYEIEDGIYFDTAKLKDYGKLAKLDIEGLKAGARIEMAEGKKNPTDFALWKFSPEGGKRQMEWEFKEKIGFPGWHIECSAMSMKFLGETFDIHCGGIDHIPVHHTNEIAQAEGATGKDFVKYWLHGEFLIMGEDKMAKSKGNFITLQSLIDEGINPIAYRYFCLNAHYRQQLNFSVEAVKAAESSLKRFREFILKLEEPEYIFEDSGTDEKLLRLIEEAKVNFDEAISDDLNTPKALGIVFDFMKEANKFIDSGKIAKKNAEDLLDTMYDFDKVLGIMDFEKDEIPEEILELAKARETARNNKDWKKSDMLRDEILKKGYLIDDTSTGFRVKKK